MRVFKLSEFKKNRKCSKERNVEESFQSDDKLAIFFPTIIDAVRVCSSTYIKKKFSN